MSLVDQKVYKQGEGAQLDFDTKYITSGEVRERLGVTRVAIHIRVKAGLLPGAIIIKPNLLTLWGRKEIEPHLVQWQQHLSKKRSNMG